MSVYCYSICVCVYFLGTFCNFLGAQFLDKYLLYGCAPSKIVTNFLRINIYFGIYKILGFAFLCWGFGFYSLLAKNNTKTHENAEYIFPINFLYRCQYRQRKRK